MWNRHEITGMMKVSAKFIKWSHTAVIHNDSALRRHIIRFYKWQLDNQRSYLFHDPYYFHEYFNTPPNTQSLQERMPVHSYLLQQLTSLYIYIDTKSIRLTHYASRYIAEYALAQRFCQYIRQHILSAHPVQLHDTCFNTVTHAKVLHRNVSASMTSGFPRSHKV